MYWTLELASKLEDAPWPATKDELIDFAIRSGAPMEVVENLQELIEEEEDISVLVLAASTEEQKGPGPIISSIISNNYNRIKIPVMIVPGNLTKVHINQIG